MEADGSSSNTTSPTTSAVSSNRTTNDDEKIDAPHNKSNTRSSFNGDSYESDERINDDNANSASILSHTLSNRFKFDYNKLPFPFRSRKRRNAEGGEEIVNDDDDDPENKNLLDRGLPLSSDQIVDETYDSAEKENSKKKKKKREPITFASVMEHALITLFKLIQFGKYNMQELKKRPLTFVLGILSCFIVVGVMALAGTALSQIPIIFMRLAEAKSGENDMYIRVGEDVAGTSLNYTRVSEVLENHKDFTYHAPRITFSSTLTYSASRCNVSANTDVSKDVNWMYNGYGNADSCRLLERGCVYKYCAPSQLSQHFTKLIVADTALELHMGFGRRWNLDPPKAGEAHVSSKTAKALGVSEGDYIILQVNSLAQMTGPYRKAGLINDYNNADWQVLVPRYMSFPVKVAKIFSDTLGKAPSSDSVVFMEYSTFMSHYAAFANPNFVKPGQPKQRLQSVDLYHYAQHIHFNLPPSIRLDMYKSSDYYFLQGRIVKFAANLLFLVGFNQVDAEFPLMTYMLLTSVFSMFFGLIISVIVFILMLLSVILIYSLLMISVENRTFEMGVLRMIGATRTNLVALVLIQSFSYAVPALATGLIAAQLSYLAVAAKISSYLGAELQTELDGQFVLLACGLGLLVPVISSILPIWHALGQNLADSLDTNRSKTKAVVFDVERSEANSISWAALLASLVMAAFGFGIYYVFPMALLSFSLTLLLWMFFALLISMLLGLVALALNLENTVERLIATVFFFWENAAIKSIVLKNLVAHRLRNRQTTMMFSLSLAFIIFVSVSFDTQVKTFTYQLEQQWGTQLYVSDSGIELNDPVVLGSIERAARSSDLIKSIAYSTNSIYWWVLPMERPEVSNVGRFRNVVQRVKGISPGLLDTLDSRFLVPAEQNTSSPFSLSEQLYTTRGSGAGLISSAFKEFAGLSGLDSEFLVTWKFQDGALPIIYRKVMLPMAFLDSAPALDFTKFPNRLAAREREADIADIAVSLPTVVRLTEGYLSSVTQVHIQRIFVDLGSKWTSSDLSKVKTLLEDCVPPGYQLSVANLQDELAPLQVAVNVSNAFFVFTTAIAMFLCFFSLVSSMYTNIQHQSKEIGVLRAIGVGKLPMYRIYVYEAYILILSASLMGLVIGFSVAYVTHIQQSLFTELPLAFVFPYELVITIFVLAIVFSFLSSLQPIVRLTNKPIVAILRLIS